MGFFLGFLMVNVFLCYIEEYLDLFDYYRWYVDDIIIVMFCELVVYVFFDELNSIYLFLYFIMEIVINGKLFFFGMFFDKNGFWILICVY